MSSIERMARALWVMRGNPALIRKTLIETLDTYGADARVEAVATAMAEAACEYRDDPDDKYPEFRDAIIGGFRDAGFKPEVDIF